MAELTSIADIVKGMQPKVFQCSRCGATMCNLQGNRPRKCVLCLVGPLYLEEVK